MEIVATAEVDYSPEHLFVEVADLERYEQWMTLVHRAEPIEDADESGNRAWDVELRAQIGPLNRSKRLRMERTSMIPDRLVVFERVETDDREHSAWVLRVEIDEVVGDAEVGADTEVQVARGASSSLRSQLKMTLSYSGSLFTAAGLRPILDREISEARQRLIDLFAPRR